MRRKWLNLLVVLAPLLGYLEWGQGQSVSLFQAEAELFARSAVHPVTLLPATPSRVLTYSGIAGIGLLLGLMFLIGLMSMNGKISWFDSPLPDPVCHHRPGAPPLEGLTSRGIGNCTVTSVTVPGGA